MTPRNLDFLRAGAHSKDLQAEKRKRQRDEPDLPLPELTMPCVFWRRRGAARPTIMVNYCTEDGLWRTHNETPAAIRDYDAYARVIRETEIRGQQFYDENHHEPEVVEDFS